MTPGGQDPNAATRFAMLTPCGRGAIATVAVRGPAAVEIVGRRFEPASGKPLAAYAAGQVVVGRFRVAPGSLEELVVALAGPEEVEVNCHGGVAAVEAIAAAIVVEGASRVEPAHWAALHERDALAAEARLALGWAATERTAAILLDQYRGALSLAALNLLENATKEGLRAIAQSLAELLLLNDLGMHLAQPWRVVFAGRPNVGKSSLTNVLLGYQRSIVFAEPGTTRDVLTARAAIDGWPVELSDTAGLRTAGDAIESAGIERAHQQIAAADLLVYVSDCTEPWTTADQRLWQNMLAIAHKRSPLVVHNKCDLTELPQDGRPQGLTVSAVRGSGLEELLRQIAVQLVPQPPPLGAAVPFTPRQFALLLAAQAAVLGNDEAAARTLLTDLIGRR